MLYLIIMIFGEKNAGAANDRPCYTMRYELIAQN